MNDVIQQPASPDRKRTFWLHFGVVCAVLLVVGIGWEPAMRGLGYWLRKEPVPWPQGVQVDAKTFQNTSLPKQFGPYRLKSDGDIKQKDDVLETLKIATGLDKARWADRKSNWYVTRIYEDTRQPENSPFRYWVLDVVYYTGGETTVPHVPDVCAQAGGATSTGRRLLRTEAPGASKPWSEGVDLAALSYERLEKGQLQRFTQYYLFCVNGLPETSREAVRLKLANPRLRYVFFSKIQFYPRGNVGGAEIADKQAKDFLRNCLPAILSQLPTQADVNKLYRKEKN